MKQNKKSNVYFGMGGGNGTLAQVLPIIDEMDKSKCNIACNVSKSGAGLFKKLGYKFLEFLEFPNLELPASVVPKGQSSWNMDHFWGRSGYTDFEYVSKLIETRLEVISRFNPDLIISQWNPPTSIVSKILKVPHVSIAQSCFHPNGKRVTWWKEINEDYFRTSITVNKVLAKYGIDPIDKMEDLHKGDLTIIPSFPEFDYVDDKNAVYIGPLLWESSKQYKGLPIQYSKGNKPLIFVYTGRMVDSGGLSGRKILENVIEAFSNSEFLVVISTGEGQVPENISSLASNIILTDWVPASEIISDCDVTIHHGGHGSCMLSLLKGVPSVVIPTTSEREFNARQLNELGTGTFIQPNELSSSRLLKEVRNVINSKNINKQAKEWSKRLKERNYGGAKAAAEAIINLLEV